jgi:hypothetical protein
VRFLLLLIALLAAPATAAQEGEVQATLWQLKDAWLSADAVVVGTYLGPDSSLGSLYHRVEVEHVWMGSPSPGPLLFKAPRGINVEPEREALIVLWDRLNAATDSYLETSTRRYGEGAWVRIGPDSLTGYLLPFKQYAFGFVDGKMVLRGTSVYKQELSRNGLRKELLEYEFTLLPAQLYVDSDVVLHARVAKLEKRSKVIQGVPVEYRIYVDFEALDVVRGELEGALRLEYASFPRSPRFEDDEEVILFLKRSPEGALYLAHGKRAVYHVIDGSVAESDQPLSEFIKSLQSEASDAGS